MNVPQLALIEVRWPNGENLTLTCVQIWSRPKWAQVNASVRKAWSNGVAIRPKCSICVYLRLHFGQGLNGKRNHERQSLNVRDIQCPMNILSFNVSYVQIKGEEISYLHYITPCDLFWFEYTTLSLCQLQGRACFKMHAGVFWGSANHRYHLS